MIDMENINLISDLVKDIDYSQKPMMGYMRR